jgi:undecaprenyl-diphosphatase
LEELISLDKELFLFLNGLGSEAYDEFWKIITKQLNWAPFILAVFYLIQRKIGWKNLGIVILFLAVLITFTDQITNLFKYSFERLRPCNDTDVNGIARICNS